MTTVRELIPGDTVVGPLPGMAATFVAETEHPLFPGTQLVIWRMADGTWSHDALHASQEVGTTEPADAASRQAALRRALLGSGAAR
jgi:hypothetical protein